MTAKNLKRRDDNIRDHVLLELKSDPSTTSSDIAATVTDGVVTLSGFVTSYWEKDAAENAAKRVYGVKGVANEIEVKPSSIRTDPEIARDVVHELERHISIPSDRIKVTVKNGWVTPRRQYWCRMAVSEDPRRVGSEEVERSDRHCQQYRGQIAGFSARGKEPDRGSATSERRA